MQKLKLLIPFALFLGAFFVACHDDDPFTSIEKKANVAFAGQIIDENGDGVPGALVKAGDQSALTDQNGIFRLASVALPANHAIISVSSTGYFDFSRAYVVKDDALQTVKIQLLTKETAGSFNATSGGVVNVTGGPKLSFPANAIVDENGNAYTGSVQVLAKYLDPKSQELVLQMPGDLTGLNLAGEKQSLSTFGMIGVELLGASGQKLKIAANSEVEVRVPIDASIVANAPTEIPLWHFDLEKAFWIEEGLAQKTGNEYVGKVKHFSYWNYDGGLPSVNVYGNVYLGDLDHPLADVEVLIAPVDPGNGWGCGHGTTNGNGAFGGAVSKDLPLKLQIVWWGGQCGSQTIYSALIGPFSSDATLPPIIIPVQSFQSLAITGRLLDCNGQPIANGYAKMGVGLTHNFVFADANGEFEFNSIICQGNTQQTGAITGYDLTNLLESIPVPINFPPNTINLGDIAVCNVVSEFIRYTLDGGQEIVSVTPFGGSDAGFVSISSGDSTQANQYLHFLFVNNGQLGTFPITDMTVNTLYASDLNSLTTNVTAFGPNAGDWMVGTFGGSFQVFNGDNHTISGSYRVKRSW